MKVTLIDMNTKGVKTMISALGICRGNDCTEDTLKKALEAKPVPHMSVLEFGWVCLKVEGVSVKTRIQLVRHRLFSTMERSTRSINMEQAKCIIPKTAINTYIYDSYTLALDDYSTALYEGLTPEDASYLLPMGVETEFFLAGNMRTWFEYFEKRLCKKHVQDEHYRLAMEMYKLIKDKFPMISQAVPCKACGKCGEKE
ncbi:MAG: FAD-dependent thymidylate synthase [Bacillota bacterium]|nr:FAD-dependent thymidylate synthase [Bacillota bacterium]